MVLCLLALFALCWSPHNCQRPERALITVRGRAAEVQGLTERVRNRKGCVTQDTLNQRHLLQTMLCGCLRYQTEHLENTSLSLPEPWSFILLNY